jgi:uncharacterized protein (TIGR03435 family)
LLPITGGISLFDAIDQQLGLKLEPQEVPTPVLVVDRVNEKPTANAADVTQKLPAEPTRFEVASIRASALSDGPRFSSRPSSFEERGGTLKDYIAAAWLQDGRDRDKIVGGPKWLDTNRFDIVAKAPADGPDAAAPIDTEDSQAMLKTLLAERFKLRAHFENRPVDAYTLVNAKPKLTKADPSNRTGCTEKAASSNGAAGLLQVVCHNMTMAQFAEEIQAIGRAYTHYPALDATGIKGAWDFTLTFSLIPPAMRLSPERPDTGPAASVAGAGGLAAALDPAGGISLPNAIDKQLGLKLEMRKRPVPVLVIDHVEMLDEN